VHDTIDRSDDFILYDDARQAGELAVRVYASVPGDGMGEAELFKELDALSSKYPDDPLFKMGGVRLSIDGGIESLDAAVLQPYETRPDDNGPNHVDPDALNRLVRLIDARGWQITLEASGDRAVRMALDALEHAAKSNKEPEKGRRHRIEGVELVDAVDVPRFGRLRTIAAIRPDEMSPTSERREAWERSMGSERASRAWPAGSLVSARGQLAFGTGWPIHPMNLFDTMQTAVTRATADGLPDGGWSAAERVSVKRAINAFTSVPAYLSFDEQRKGSLKKGMLADLVVLTTDIFDAPVAELNRASVAATIFDGKIVYQRNAKSTN
jgi:predicted amidohydrolase YtcJ